MGLIPAMFKPATVIRRNAVQKGFRGDSTLWKIVGVWVFGRCVLKKVFGKQPEVIDVASLGAGRQMSLTTARPLSKRERRKLKRAGVPVYDKKQHRALATLWAEDKAD